jgi:peptide/nickel transport system substrate-binding protein
MISPKALADPARDLAKTPGDAGSGPYLLTTYDPAVKYSFQKAPGTYWDPKAGRLASLEVQIISSTAARVNALKSGQVDLAHVQAPEAADVAKEAEAGAAFKAYKRDKFFSMHNLMLHAANGKLADQRVRQAISYAIDRDGIAQGLLNGACTPAYQPYPDGHWANDPNLKTPYTLDVAKAKQLITDAGASGTAMEIIVAANTPFQLIAEAVQSQLKDIGINATITPKATAADSAAAFRGGAGDGFESSIVGTADPSVLLQENYLAGYGLIADPAAKTEIQNLANQALDPKLDQAARGKIYRDVWNKLSTSVWDVKICRTFQTYGYAPKVHGVEQMGWTFSGVFDARTLWVSK